MSELLFKIPKRISDNFGDPINILLKYVAEINSTSVRTIHFDFTNCKFSSPFLLAGLVSLAKTKEMEGFHIKYSFNENNKDVFNYFKTIGFPVGFNFKDSQLINIENILIDYHTKTYIPLIYFPTSKKDSDNKLREQIISAVNSILKTQLKLQGNTLQAIYYLIDELTQNVTDHSESKEGMIFAQFFPSKNYLDLCIADYGKGLLQSYIDAKKHHPQNSAEAMNFAIYGKSTKDLPESRGYGISTSRKMLVEGLKGKFFIYSGNSFFIQHVEKEEVVSTPDQYNYKGCYVALRIPILQNAQFDFYKFVE